MVMKVVIRKQKSRFSLFMLIMSFTSLNIIVGGNIVFFILNERISIRIDELPIICLFLLVTFLINLYIINYIIWQIRGYEIIEMSEEMLSIKRKGKLFHDSSTISINKIVKVEEHKYEPPTFASSWHNPFMVSKMSGEEGGRIRVIYNTKFLVFRFKIATDFGQGLSKEEACIYVKQMNDILSNRQ